MQYKYEMCRRRLVSTEVKMSKDADFKEKCCSKQICLHHFRTTTASTPKARMVFDTRATYKRILIEFIATNLTIPV